MDLGGGETMRSGTTPGSVTLLREDDVWKNRHVIYVGRKMG